METNGLTRHLVSNYSENFAASVVKQTYWKTIDIDLQTFPTQIPLTPFIQKL